MTARLLSALVSGATRRPLLVIAVAAVAGIACAAFALRLHPSSATDTFVDSSSPSYRATQRFNESFGEEPIEILVRGSLRKLVLSSDLQTLVGLEGCLSGNVPAQGLLQEGGAKGPCGLIDRSHAVKVVLGPGTFINEAAGEIDEQLARQISQADRLARQSRRLVETTALRRGMSEAKARELGRQTRKLTLSRLQEGLVKLGLEYGLGAPPSLQDTGFVEALVFTHTDSGQPKPRFAYLFPGPDAALVSVRLRAGLSEQARAHAIGLIRRAVAMPQWHLAHGESYLVTGEPVIISDLSSSIVSSLRLLLVAVVLVMAATLGLIFGAQGLRRLLPLVLALLATATTFAALALAGAKLTIASIAVLPVLVGLAVDYAVQFQSGVQEAGESGLEDRRAVVGRAAMLGAPTIATAAAASVAALLVLLLSPVPMVRGFGIALAVGVTIAFLCALLVGSAALAYTRPAAGAALQGPAGASVHAGPMRSAALGLGPAWRGAGELLRDNPLTRLISRMALESALRRPWRVLAIAVVLAAAGWALSPRTPVETDITKLVPQSLPSLRNLDTLERLTGVGGEIDVMISGADLTRPAVIEWMSSYERRVLAKAGYSSRRGCARARLCPAFSLPSLFEEGTSRLTGGQVRGLLKAIPSYFSQEVITPDRRLATLAFGIRLMPLKEQQRLIERMRSQLHPPPGVRAQLVGLPVLAAESASQVSSLSRRIVSLLVGFAGVALVLLVAFRGDLRRALVPMVPIVLATGWSALILFAIGVPLNPMSVTLGTLVIAISTEFSVLLAERQRRERLAGQDLGGALRRSYRRTGAAVACSGVTAIAGFAVLALSDIRMLRDFGLVTLVDLSVSLLGVLLVLPATLAIAERRVLRQARHQRARTRENGWLRRRAGRGTA